MSATLFASAALTWAVRRPAERYGARVVLLGLAAATAAAGALLLVFREPWLVVAAAMLGNVSVSTGESGAFLSLEQVVLARALAPERRTWLVRRLQPDRGRRGGARRRRGERERIARAAVCALRRRRRRAGARLPRAAGDAAGQRGRG